MEPPLIDHLFRHHSGKMVSVLTRIFGLEHFEIIEDAVQDTFIKASIAWRNNLPENPEAWLTQAAKNRVLDIFRKLKAKKKYLPEFKHGLEAIAMKDLFLDEEIEDAQLRMIFTACHPQLDARDRISFALKTVSGFNAKEISSALLAKEETVKKRLSRARKVIKESSLKFSIPQGKELPHRLASVMEVLYLIFNEGFHSNRQEKLIREDLCREAMRLCKMLLKNENTRTSAVYALLALMCFHAARLDAKLNSENELIDLKTQDRGKWYFPYIEFGNTMMNKAVENEEYTSYHYEAAIAAEHVRAKRFEDTRWDKILYWYQCLYHIQPMPIHLLNMSVVCLQNKSFDQAKEFLDQISPSDFSQRAYLYYGALADYHFVMKEESDALIQLDLALATVTNEMEKKYIQRKKMNLLKK